MTAFLTAVAAFVVFGVVFAAAAWLITASPVILAVIVAATAGFIACAARANRKGEW